jgi:hypothetical protein
MNAPFLELVGFEKVGKKQRYVVVCYIWALSVNLLKNFPTVTCRS